MTPDITAVDRALDRLHGQTSLEDRLGVLRELVQFWHGPIGPEDGMSEEELAGIPLPRPLRWWYGWAGKRSEILSGQNLLLTPAEQEEERSEIEDGRRLFFYVENQGVYQWSTLPEGGDPPVFGRYNNADPWTPGSINTLPWEQEYVSLSEHLILACLFEAVFCHAKFGASTAWLEERKLAEIVRIIPPVAIMGWRWAATKFYARGGVFMCAAPNENIENEKMYSVWIGAKTEHPLLFLKPYLNDSWDYVAV